MERKIFGTDGIRGKVNVYPMTAETILKLGIATAKVFTRDNGKRHRIIIGKDTRISGYVFEYALAAGFCSMGMDVYLVGPLPTPAIAHLTKSMKADAGIVISASHNPAGDNGIKFFSADGYKLPDSVEKEIESLIFNNKLSTEHIPIEKAGKAFKMDDAKGRYIEFAKGSVNNISLHGLKIVLDCANGAGYQVAPLIFRELGADVVVMNYKPDGLNINENAGSLHPEYLSAAVLSHNADVGIALDGDADRIIMVDDKGEVVDGDEIMAISALHLKSINQLNNNTLVATVMSNLGLDLAMKENGINLIKTKVGDRYVIEEMKNNDYILGGEQSGHLIFSKHATTGDGIISGLQVLKIIRESKKKLSQLKQCMKKYPQILINVEVKEKKPVEELQAYKNIQEIESILGEKGRVLVRYSGTQNKCRVMLEGEDQKQIEQYAKDIVKKIKEEIGE